MAKNRVMIYQFYKISCLNIFFDFNMENAPIYSRFLLLNPYIYGKINNE